MCMPLAYSVHRAILLFFSLVYRPAIMQMDKDMRRTRAMLLVFPDEVQSLAYG